MHRGRSEWTGRLVRQQVVCLELNPANKRGSKKVAENVSRTLGGALLPKAAEVL